MLTVAPAWRSFLTTLELPEKDAIISAVFPFWRWRKRGGDTKRPIWGYFVSVVFKCGMDNAIVTQVEGLSAKAKFLYNSITWQSMAGTQQRNIWKMCTMNGSNDEKSIQRTEATVGKKFKVWQRLCKLVFQSTHNVSAAKPNNIAIGLEYIF